MNIVPYVHDAHRLLIRLTENMSRVVGLSEFVRFFRALNHLDSVLSLSEKERVKLIRMLFINWEQNEFDNWSFYNYWFFLFGV